MTPKEKMISEANKYVMPAVDDYLGARCLLLNNIFVGLTLVHEAVEKLIKAILILENIKIPKSCHNLTILTKLLSKKDSVKYNFLNDNEEFIKLLDQHYGWRYHDGDIKKRSKLKSPEDLHPADALWITLYELYMNFLPSDFQFGTYFHSFLFEKSLKEYTNWSEMLLEKNNALTEKIDIWERGYEIFLAR